MKKLRFLLLLGVCVALFGVLETKLYYLQITKRDFYVEKAEALGEIRENLALRRGQIFITDRNGNEISAGLNKDYPIIYAVPKEIENPEKTASLLTPIIGEARYRAVPGEEEERLKEILSNTNSRFRLLVDKASEEMLRKIEEIKLPGIHTDSKQHRYYQFEKLASHALGFVGVNEKYNLPTGLYGIEKYYNAELASGDEIRLTIDRNIQTQSETILQGLMETFGAKSGTIIVEDPNSGKILALANAPDFNPNLYSKSPIENFLNPATQSVYEPGSVFKPLTMAAGIDLGVITPETTFYDSGSVTINGEEMKNWDLKAHGTVTMTNVLEQSINTGAVFAARKIGKKNFLKYTKRFGFGEKTDIDLPDEVTGSLQNLERKDSQEIDLWAASFGQGTAVTPVQLIGAFSSIANGGKLMRPYLDTSNSSHVVRKTMSKETSEKVTRMMESAVEKAFVAALPEHRIAGKTGTAEIADLERGGYTEEYNHTYVGFGPASDPKFVALIKLERPQATLAGATVVPAFRELARFIINYYNIPPDKTSE